MWIAVILHLRHLMWKWQPVTLLIVCSLRQQPLNAEMLAAGCDSLRSDLKISFMRARKTQIETFDSQNCEKLSSIILFASKGSANKKRDASFFEEIFEGNLNARGSWATPFSRWMLDQSCELLAFHLWYISVFYISNLPSVMVHTTQGMEGNKSSFYV